MTSSYARHGTLSHETIRLYGHMLRSTEHRVAFYLSYFQEVVPDGVTVHHIPSATYGNPRQEIELRTVSGRIFMSGLVSKERGYQILEECAADEAYTKWDDGDCVQFDDGGWRFFTAKENVRMYSSFPGHEYEMMESMEPVDEAREVAAWLQRQYDSLRNY